MFRCSSKSSRLCVNRSLCAGDHFATAQLYIVAIFLRAQIVALHTSGPAVSAELYCLAVHRRMPFYPVPYLFIYIYHMQRCTYRHLLTAYVNKVHIQPHTTQRMLRKSCLGTLCWVRNRRVTQFAMLFQLCMCLCTYVLC